MYIPLTTEVTGFKLSLFPPGYFKKTRNRIAITRFFKITGRKNQVA